MAVTLFGNDSVTLAVEVPPALGGTPVLFIEASALRNPRGARVYVEVCLEEANGQQYELGNFTFFGAIRDEDKQVFAFPLGAEERAAPSSGMARVLASMKPFDANEGDVSDVRVDLRAWVEVR